MFLKHLGKINTFQGLILRPSILDRRRETGDVRLETGDLRRRETGDVRQEL